MSDNYDELKSRGFSDRDIERLPIDELLRGIERWMKKTRRPGAR
jgi:hypothetical protein